MEINSGRFTENSKKEKKNLRLPTYNLVREELLKKKVRGHQAKEVAHQVKMLAALAYLAQSEAGITL